MQRIIHNAEVEAEDGDMEVRENGILIGPSHVNEYCGKKRSAPDNLGDESFIWTRIWLITHANKLGRRCASALMMSGRCSRGPPGVICHNHHPSRTAARVSRERWPLGWYLLDGSALLAKSASM